MLTVVVPSFNRQDFLLRQIRYWAPGSARLIIVDGTSMPLDSRVQAAVDTNSRMTYLHCPKSVEDRLELASGLIDTPYAVLLGDDEFHLQTGLVDCINLLEHDQSLVACIGQVLSFSPVGSYRRVVLARAYSSLDGRDIVHADPSDRLMAAMSGYTPMTCYAVLRTPIWQKSWGALHNWGSAHTAELQQAMTVHLLGGVATTGHIQWLRSIENAPVATVSKTEEGKIWFPEWWEDARFDAEHAAFVDNLSRVTADELGVDRDECASWVVAGAESFANENRWMTRLDESSQSFPVRLTHVLAGMLRSVARCFPEPLFLGVKRWRGHVQRFLGRSGGSYYGTVEDLSQIFREEGLRVTPEVLTEIASIEVLIREFHEVRRQE